MLVASTTNGDNPMKENKITEFIYFSNLSKDSFLDEIERTSIYNSYQGDF
jgi:hypothetical protein